MLIRICKKYEIVLINIVRRQEQVDILREEGAEIVIDSSTDAFEEELKHKIREFKPTAFFDAIGGKFPSKVLSLMPNNSTMYVYGNLSGEPIYYDATNLIFKGHNISHFFVWAWINNLSAEDKSKWFGCIVDDINSGGEIFGTKISKSFPLSEFEEGMRYAKEHASEGKVILKPQL
jgi:NADPH:quinone reductase